MRTCELNQRKKIRVVGIMSGTSLDGVDFVLTEVTRKNSDQDLHIEFLEMASVRFPKSLREKLLQAANHSLKVDALAELHFELGRFYSLKLKTVLQAKGWKPELIGLHGQTVYHKGRVATLQIGEPSFLSADLQVPVVSDFRTADIAVGGQGAPLAPFFHQVAFAGNQTCFSVHNLGGISNLTLFKEGQVLAAFDTGPANMPMDWCVQIKSKGKLQFDASGKLARKGQAHLELVKEVSAHPFFKKKAPKSCGREEFGDKWIRPLLKKYKKLSTEDLLASLTEAVAISIAHAYKKLAPLMPHEIVFCGGGSKNEFLLERIQSHLPDLRVLTSETKGWPSQAIEGAAFALLAAARVWEVRLDLQGSTGALKSASLGKISDL